MKHLELYHNFLEYAMGSFGTIFPCARAHTHAHAYARTHTHTVTHMHTHAWRHAHAHTHTHVRTHTHARMGTHFPEKKGVEGEGERETFIMLAREPMTRKC